MVVGPAVPDGGPVTGHPAPPRIAPPPAAAASTASVPPSPPPPPGSPDPLPVASGPDPSRSGARWVAGTGAFLLVLAASVFGAVRWDEIPDAAKLATVVLATGTALVLGRWLRPRLPVTASALFHLGAFLLPIDVGALAVDRGVGWPGVVLAEGVAGLVAFTLLARWERTAPLRWAVGASGIAFAVGLAAVSPEGTAGVPLSPGVVLAALGAAALAGGRQRLATAWAAAAATTPLVAVGASVAPPTGAWAELGVAPPVHPWAALAVGLVAATILGIEAHRRGDLGLAAASLGAVVLGAVGSWTDARPGPQATQLALAAGFALAEVGALLVRGDDLWRRPAGLAARALEVPAGAGALAAATLVALHPFGATATPSGTVAGACALVGLGWFVADLRRSAGESPGVGPALVAGGGWSAAHLAAGASLSAATLLAAGPLLAAIVMLALAAALMLTGRPGGSTAAVCLASWSPVLVLADHPLVAAPSGALGALLLARGARQHADAAVQRPAEADLAWRHALGALAPAAVAGMAVALELDVAAGVLGAAALLWAAGVVADPVVPCRWADGLGHPARLASIASLAWWAHLTPSDAVLLAGGLSGAVVLDAHRTGDRRLAYALAVTAPATVLAATGAIGFETAIAGLALCLAATVAAGVAALVPEGWRRPLAATAGTALVVGLGLAAVDPSVLGASLILTSGVVLGAALLRPSVELSILGGLALVVGVWLVLGAHQVAAADAYAAPVAAALLVVGASVQRTDDVRISSWITSGPALALLGTTALAERFDGGSGWHAVVAGAVGVAAVAIGGARRLAAPLLLGPALVVVTAAAESLAFTRGVPTWTWLALGGAVLLIAGVVMERKEVGPIETGRRLVDVLRERYS